MRQFLPAGAVAERGGHCERVALVGAGGAALILRPS